MSTLRWSDLRFAAGVALPALTVEAVLHRPGKAFWGVLLVFSLIALTESFLPLLAHSPPAGGPGSRLRWFLRAFVPVQLVLLAAGLHAAAGADGATIASVAFAVGFVTGSQGITFAHELGHSRHRGDRALAWLLMGSVLYPQFMVEHYRGHHVRAATHDDPATARLGESLWRFLPRTVAGNLLGAWRLEALRLRQLRRSWLASPLLAWTVIDLGWLAVLAAVDLRLLVFWLAQSAFAVFLLESVNYIEHYGLQRATGPDGRPEPFGIQHAWNADHVVSNSLLANLQRHSDHHMHAWKPFGELQPLPGPQLPTSYSGCILLASLPPMWFALMHPRLDAAAARVAATS